MTATIKHTRGPVSPQIVLAYEHPDLVERLQEKEGMSAQEAEDLFRDMLRFLYLCGTSDQIFGPSERIDVAWHNFILFTKDYQRFCHDHFGHFIHHQPIKKSEKSKERGAQIVALTLSAAKAAFGELSSNWVYARRSADCEQCSPTTNCQDPDCHDS